MLVTVAACAFADLLATLPLRCAWPQSFHERTELYQGYYHQCWPAPAIQWALDNGSTWLDWQCWQLGPSNYYCTGLRKMYSDAEHNDDQCRVASCEKRLAADVFAWAHENGCPCTCGQGRASDATIRYRVYSSYKG
jgi:hypothetical protein